MRRAGRGARLFVICNVPAPAMARWIAMPQRVSLVGLDEMVAGMVSPRRGPHPEKFDGADLFDLDGVLRREGRDDDSRLVVLLADLRTAVSMLSRSARQPFAARATRLLSRAPPTSSMWSSRFAAFSAHEAAAWTVAAVTDSLLAKAELDDGATVVRNLPSEIETAAAIDARLPGVIARLVPPSRSLGDWPGDWSEDMRAQFDCLCFDAQRRASFYAPGRLRYKPSSYGTFWRTQHGGYEWYKWMYEGRRRAHEDCIATIHALERAEGRPLSVMDVGCGMGVGYTEALAARRFVGVDLAQSAIDWCNRHATAPEHTFLCDDLLSEGAPARLAAYGCDFVFSQGTIDNSWDMYAYLRGMRDITRKWLYVTAYRGWFPELKAHRYMWAPDTTAYYNDISPSLVGRQLRELGFAEVSVTAIETGNPPPQPPVETRILAAL